MNTPDTARATTAPRTEAGETATAGAASSPEGASAGTLATRFQALSDEKRLRILEILGAGECCVCDLTDTLEVGQSLLSFHLRTLRDAGLVSARRDGRWMYYSLVPGAVAELEKTLGRLREVAVSHSGACEGRCCIP